ncbi:MAG: branched-chain amino acid aminotransferase, partial [Fastidiosipila sp.]|nr:branched-chain amino acid aminotransferase [Fastidiosipila sp.]
MDIKVIETVKLKDKPQDESKLGFGKIFSDHMFIVEYDEGAGWHDARIQVLENLSLHPASSVFHYGQEIFEGAKAYRREDGEIQVFRLMDNCKRMVNSAVRSSMPELDSEFQYNAILKLIDLERDWVPHSEGTSLYLRPTMIASTPALGAHSAHDFIYFVLCSPSGSYYPKGMQPVRIRIEPFYARSVKGGMGRAKTGGNYAASFKATKEAQDAGYEQVLWLDGMHKKYVQEVGAMNIMFVIDDAIVTPELGDTILPGITRASVLHLASELGYKIEERPVSVDEIYEAHASGRLSESFGTGTAAVISPVGEYSYQGESIILNNNEIGPLAQRFYDLLTGIQFGTAEDKYGWTSLVPRY